MSVGDYVHKILDEYNYYGAFLPRMPVIIEREIKKELATYEAMRARKAENLKRVEKNAYERGVKCLALSNHQWHYCEIAERITPGVEFAKVLYIQESKEISEREGVKKLRQDQ